MTFPPPPPQSRRRPTRGTGNGTPGSAFFLAVGGRTIAGARETTAKDVRMAGTAHWWNPEAGADDAPVVRHAPDRDHYHYPDERQMGLLGAYGIGAPLVVPKARRDGGPAGFDCHKAAVVHVDPDAPDGGTVVDLGHLQPAAVRKALATSRFPHQVFYQLGVSPDAVDDHGRLPAAPPRTNPHVGTGYITPRAAADGSQVAVVSAQAPAADPASPYFQMLRETPVSSMLPPAPRVNGPTPPLPPPVAAAAAAPAAMLPPGYPYPPPAYAVPPPPAFDPNMAQMLHSMAQGLHALHQRLAGVEARAGEPEAAAYRPPVMATLPNTPVSAGRRK